jgi:hypothetical protein
LKQEEDRKEKLKREKKIDNLVKEAKRLGIGVSPSIYQSKH